MTLPDPRTPAGRTRWLAAAAVAVAVAGVVWYGWVATTGQVRPTVTGYAVDSDASMRVSYDLVRPQGVAVRCRVSALDVRKGRVGTVEDLVSAEGPAAVGRSVVIRTSARAVTGVVESCTRTSG